MPDTIPAQNTSTPSRGPLSGVRIVEVGGIGAAPYGCMMLADMGAEVVRIERREGPGFMTPDSPMLRNRRSVVLDLKRPEGREAVLALAEKADVLVEAFRPGVAERLGIGPADCWKTNPKLVYARMTGWGQEGPLSQTAGHDLNYIGLTGLLHQIGPTGGKPTVPMNVIGDFGGGGLLMAYGIVCAVFEASRSGKGQVVDAAMVDGALSFMAMFFGYRHHGQFSDRTGGHLLGGAAHYYEVYETSDGKAMAVGSLEPQFYAILVERCELDPKIWLPAGYPALDPNMVSRRWPELKIELARVFKTRTREEWTRRFEGSDACVTPVLSLEEAAVHPHARARGMFIEVDGMQQQAPAPRFSRTPAPHPAAPPATGADGEAVFHDWGLGEGLLSRLKASGALHLPSRS